MRPPNRGQFWDNFSLEEGLWRATAEVLLLDREIWREQARRGAAMGRFSGDHYRVLRLLGSARG